MSAFPSPALIKEAFGPTSFQRGFEYFKRGMVRSINPKDGHPGSYVAVVKGSLREPYSVNLSIERNGEKFKIESECTCPLESDCKHVVAALLVLSTQPQIDGTLPPKGPTISPLVRDWLGDLDRAEKEGDFYPEEIKSRLIYVISLLERGEHAVQAFTARILKDGRFSEKPTKYELGNIYRAQTPAYIKQSDLAILRDLYHLPGSGYKGAVLSGRMGRATLQALVATGRCHVGSILGPRVTIGEPRLARGGWSANMLGEQSFQFALDSKLLAFPFDEPWYLDPETGECGPLDAGLEHHVAAKIVKAPTLMPADSVIVRKALEAKFPDRPDLWPRAFRPAEDRKEIPVPCLTVSALTLTPSKYYSYLTTHGDVGGDQKILTAKLSFRYGPVNVKRGDGAVQMAFLEDDLPVRISRDWEAEYGAEAILAAHSFRPFQDTQLSARYALPKGHGGSLVLMESSKRQGTQKSMDRFFSKVIPDLETEGWEVTLPEELVIRKVASHAIWDIATTDGSASEWFNLNLGVEFEGGRIDLMPILVDLLRKIPRAEILEIEKAGPDDFVTASLADGRKVGLPAKRVYPLLTALYDLYDGATDGTDGQLHRAKAAQIADLDTLSWLSWSGSDRIRDLSLKLKAFKGLRIALPPPGFKAELRPYQQEGLNWLQFLREYELGGVLADDMGLGKTVQALAHILVEKVAGRLTKPCLVVAPTSLMANWRLEAQKFAPELRVLTLHGAERKGRFNQIASHDLILTTYPLLGRDTKALLAEEFGLVILDEAQNIKNHQSIMAQTACQLRAANRVCLTGTPLENHLGELWSIFRFLMPGFLGNETQFRRHYRTPIEKNADDLARKSLARRVAPFMIRRTKDQVASELPPKTEILEAIELEGGQRDLYESVRLAMHEKVRNAIKLKGASKSHIIVLDALLKLRQVCCDPRLVKLEDARKVDSSAKLERLIEMLPEMLGEGRRVLLFSQFTSMLALIEASLAPLGISYALLTGETTDREAQINKFQDGEVALFLISLKAGGTGLNLTSADTVIHYDPWWNPAVENQASDRAHRIGQTKNVFVYKLICLGTVEEKIAELQEKKGKLAAGIFSEDAATPMKLTAEDMEGLFAGKP